MKRKVKLTALLLVTALLLSIFAFPAAAEEGHITVTQPEAIEVTAGNILQLDLNMVFSDGEGHSLQYTVINDEGNIATTKLANSVYCFTSREPTPEGKPHTPVITASCGTDSASVTLSITVNPAAEGLKSQYGYEETPASKVTVYVTISNDGVPLRGNDENHTVLEHLEVTVPYYDLGIYGLDAYKRYGTENGQGDYVGTDVIERPTAMHLFIYLLQRYYMGLPENQCGSNGMEHNPLDDTAKRTVYYKDGEKAYEAKANTLVYTGSAKSSYMQQFWGHDENLMYFRNHVYPLEKPGWGSTSDYILLSEGDTIDLAMFSDWSFYSRGGFCSFAVNGKVDRELENTTFTAAAGEAFQFSTVKFGTQGVAEGGTDAFVPVSGLTVTARDENGAEVEVTEVEGGYSCVFTKPGTYYLLGTDPDARSEEASLAPATAKVVVSEKQKLPGDANGDGSVDALDAALVLQYAAGHSVTLDVGNSDVNGDSAVNALDAALILQYAAGLRGSL